MSDTELVDKVPQGLARRDSGALARFRLIPNTLGEAMEMAKLISGSELCPKNYKGRAADCIVAYDYGASLGLSWMQALRCVAVINGVPSIFGDAVPALIYGSGECERFHEYFDGAKGTDAYTAVCIMKRKGYPDEKRRTFSVADAKAAKLWQKRGRDGQDTPWITYEDRMLQMRARGFAARDTFPDKLAGLILAEEAMDYPDAIDVTATTERDALPPSPLEKVSDETRASLEKAFLELKIGVTDPVQGFHPTAFGVTKINEFLGAKDAEPERAALALLEWCKDEYSKRKTGQPRKKSNDENGKTKKVEAVAEGAASVGAATQIAPAVVATPAVPSVPGNSSQTVPPSGLSSSNPNGGASDGRPAGAEALAGSSLPADSNKPRRALFDNAVEF